MSDTAWWNEKPRAKSARRHRGRKPALTAWRKHSPFGKKAIQRNEPWFYVGVTCRGARLSTSGSLYRDSDLVREAVPKDVVPRRCAGTWQALRPGRGR